ncbi:MAG: exosporium glycoprotein BclB-related protein [Erysipelotrichaceae bacterium]
MGPAGATGPVGPMGPVGSTIIVPFASGMPIKLSTKDCDDTNAFLGFGNSCKGIPTVGQQIDMNQGCGCAVNMAFSIPRTAKITSISAYFSSTCNANLSNTVAIIEAAIYIANANNVFTLAPTSVLNLTPALTGIIQKGTNCMGIANNLNITLNPMDRILLVFSIAANSSATNINIEGFASAGICME